MNIKNLEFGIGLILRERVSGWATSGSDTPHVYPDHPPIDLNRSSYPRAAIDTIGHRTTEQDVEQNVEVGDALVDVTVYGDNSSDVKGLLGDVHDAILQYHDKDDQSGSPYLENWGYERTGLISSIVTEEADPGFTRYSKTIETEYSHVTTT